MLHALAFAFVAVLAYQVTLRVAFPWDFWIWSESPFMTNMLKLSNGESTFDAPRDANSWVYSPGLEYLCFALLRPLGLQLDIRAARIVAVALGLVAAVFASRSAAELLAVLRKPSAADRSFRLFAIAALVLLFFRSFTSDVVHADNLYIAHASISLYLCIRAASTGSYRGGLLAVGVSALGPLAKQTGSFGFVGIAVVLCLLHGSRWSLGRRLGLIALGAGIWAGATGLLMSSANSRFWLFDLLSRHAVVWSSAVSLLHLCFEYPHRVVLLGLALLAAMRLVASRDRRAGVFLASWAAGLTAVLPALAGYLKVGGGWNNLTIFDLWIAILALPVAWGAMASAFERDASAANDAPTREGGVGRATTWAAALALLVIFLVPLKLPPTRGQYAFGHALDAAVRDDLAAGRRILLPHGMMPLLRAGHRVVPMDRAGSVLESNMGEHADLPGTKARVEEHYYDRIYLFVSDWYGQEIVKAIEQNYHEVLQIPGDATYPYVDEYLSGQTGFMHRAVRVMAPN
ncbi:MAG: hypothetical protein KF819_27435 [Labilithrix sp.]|nr:hypothetical protein [Labilithrix sp.]